MADQRPEIRAPLTAEVVEHFGFRVALRGFDTGQVREFLRSVAEMMRAQSTRIAELERSLRDAEQRAEHPVLDDDKLAAALGDETARVLRSAHEAAADIRGRAQEHVERVVQQARDESGRLTAEAASILDVRRAAAEAEAAEIHRVASEEAARMVADAGAAVASMTSEAEESARKAVEQAKSERNEVLSDVRLRRRVANTQIEQLRAGRERLLAAYSMVRSTLDQVTTELEVADDEARSAADAVGRRMNAAIDPNQADALASPPSADVVEAVAAGPTPVPASDQPARPVPEQSKAEAPSRPHRKGGKGARPPVATPTVVAADPVRNDEPASEVQATPEAQTTPSEAAAEPDPVEDATGRGAVGAAPSDAEPTSDSTTEAPTEAPTEATQTQASANDELFERLRNERAASVEQAKEVLRETEVTEPVPADPAVAAEAVAVRLAQARDETCAGLEQHLARRLKRALQDEQNLVLDRLRSVRGSMSADAALGAESEHLTAYVVIVEPALADAARAGAGVAATTAPVDVADELVTSVASDLAMELVLPLRRRLDERLHEAAAVGDDTITASDRVSSAYREAKAQRVGRLAGDWLANAWAVGVHAATPAGTLGVWMSAAIGGCCTDCDDNRLAGPVPAGSSFPTGHLYPPAHPGCRCVIAPIP